MLTADLVKARVVKGALKVQATDAERAREFAQFLLSRIEGCVGKDRTSVLARLEYDARAKDLHLYRGLKKLVLDRASFELPEGIDPPSLREEIFSEMSARFRKNPECDRRDILKEYAASHSLSVTQVEAWMFADRKEEQRLVSFDECSIESLLASYERSKIEAIALKATHLQLSLHSDDKRQLRTVLQRIKFQGLLFKAESQDEGFVVSLDGPMSLFSQTTRYGLKLAMALRCAMTLPSVSMTATLEWGKRTTKPATFSWSQSKAQDTRLLKHENEIAQDFVHRYRAYKDKHPKKKLPEVKIADEIMQVGNQELCLPDLVFEREGKRVFLEFLGFWSREAVFKRASWADALPAPVLFAYSEKLRVSEKVAPRDSKSSLLSFKGTLSISAVAKALKAAGLE